MPEKETLAMSSVSVINCLLLLTVFLYFATERVESFDTSINDHRNKEASPMWFGPRIGRKKRNPGDKVYRNDKEQSSSGLLDVLRESPLVVVAVNEAAKQHNFTPRLGRESGESLPNWLEEADFIDADALSPRSNNPFAPRLGRNNYSPFTPRMGRESESPLK